MVSMLQQRPGSRGSPRGRIRYPGSVHDVNGSVPAMPQVILFSTSNDYAYLGGVSGCANAVTGTIDAINVYQVLLMAGHALLFGRD